MLCDAHIHYIPAELSGYTSFYKGLWSDKTKLFEYLRLNNIAKALITYPSTDAYLKIGEPEVCRLYNYSLERLIKESSQVLCAGLVDFKNLKDAEGQVRRLKEKGFRAVSIASSYQGDFLIKELIPLFKGAQKHKMPIFVHPQTVNPIGFERVKDPLLMPVLEYSFDLSMFLGLLVSEGILQDFEVKFIFSSLGGITPFLKNRFDRVYAMLLKRGLVKNLGSVPSVLLSKVYVEASGACLDNIKIALGLFGPERILWGSDYPVCGDVKNNIEMLEELENSIKEKIKSDNFLELFDIQ